MGGNKVPAVAVFVLFGAAGDLSRRLVVPALFNLFLDGHLSPRFTLLGLDRQDLGSEAFRERLRAGVAQYSRRGEPSQEGWRSFAQAVEYMRLEAGDSEGFHALAGRLAALTDGSEGVAQTAFYLATPPALFGSIAASLDAAGLAGDREQVRIVVEKPLGHDLASFRSINAGLAEHFEEGQIFRIDHFLGKETVQNILALRFANPIFEPIWDRRYIDHVAITVAETLGVEHRAAYYEHAGALRDMVQNHLMQLLCLVAMEPPATFAVDDIRNKKMDVMHALRPISSDAVYEFAAQGQYGPGWLRGVQVPGYREEPAVATDSNVETYAALKLHVDNWRWQDVPFYLRTGKRMPAAVSEISIRFRPVPHRAFPASASQDNQPVRLVLRIQPDEGIDLKFNVKTPAKHLELQPVDMRFSYREAFRTPVPAAYETLLRDVLAGDPSLFMRADQVEAAWRLLMPVLEMWSEHPAPDFPDYASGSWGPEAGEALIARDGRSWLTPTLVDAE